MVNLNEISSVNTENKTLKEIIQEQKALIHSLKSVIDNLPGSIYWKNKEGVYLGSNHFSMEKMKSVGLSSDSIVGKTDYDLFPKAVSDQYRKNDLEVITQGCGSSKEEIITLSTGETLTQLSFKHPLRDEHNNIIGNTVDITPLKKVEAALREEKEKAEKANQSKTEMIRHMEHDIRTPFSGILVLANHLEAKETDPTKKQILTDISASAKELLSYCNCILDVIKTETSLTPYTEKTFNVKALLSSAISIETVAAKAKNLKLVLDISRKVPELVIGDPHRIMIHLTVEDSGIGLPPEKLNTIYQNSMDLDFSELIRYKREGLGLPLVKKLIQELEGEFKIKSKIGKGSKFMCILPLKIPSVT